MTDRQCISCRQIKDRKNFIKVTKTADSVVINPDSLTFGRSAYLCYNKTCIESALKKNKLDKILKTKISDELKGQLFNELRNGENK